jgi:hypothetical protein
MASADRVLETTTSTGTGDLTTAGAVTGFRTFNNAHGVGVPFDLCIEAVDANGVPTGDWEVTEAHLTTSTNLVRSRLKSSSTGSVVSFAAGTKRIFSTQIADEEHTIGGAYATSLGMNLP